MWLRGGSNRFDWFREIEVVGSVLLTRNMDCKVIDIGVDSDSDLHSSTLCVIGVDGDFAVSCSSAICSVLGFRFFVFFRFSVFSVYGFSVLIFLGFRFSVFSIFGFPVFLFFGFPVFRILRLSFLRIYGIILRHLLTLTYFC